jgi:acyl carrier protein
MAAETMVSAEATAARASTERAMAQLWQDILRLEQLPGAEDSFFALGGESITMTMVLFRLQEERSIELEPAALLQHPTLGAFCAFIDARSRSA